MRMTDPYRDKLIRTDGICGNIGRAWGRGRGRAPHRRRFIQRGAKALREPSGLIISPEVHEEQARLLLDQMVVERSDLNPVPPKFGDHC
jgi:hypothetical protein